MMFIGEFILKATNSADTRTSCILFLIMSIQNGDSLNAWNGQNLRLCYDIDIFCDPE